MNKLRQQFWEDARSIIDWCSSEELRVLSQMASKEIESRLSKESEKLDNDIERIKKSRKKVIKKNARKVKRYGQL